jgi:hypothetical protein
MSYCVHTLNTKKIYSNLNSLNTFLKETGSNKVKLSKVGSIAIVPLPGGRAQQRWISASFDEVQRLDALYRWNSLGSSSNSL